MALRLMSLSLRPLCLVIQAPLSRDSSSHFLLCPLACWLFFIRGLLPRNLFSLHKPTLCSLSLHTQTFLFNLSPLTKVLTCLFDSLLFYLLLDFSFVFFLHLLLHLLHHVHSTLFMVLILGFLMGRHCVKILPFVFLSFPLVNHGFCQYVTDCCLKLLNSQETLL